MGIDKYWTRMGIAKCWTRVGIDNTDLEWVFINHSVGLLVRLCMYICTILTYCIISRIITQLVISKNGLV